MHTHILGIGLKSRKIANGTDSLSCSIVQPYSEIRKVSLLRYESLLFSLVSGENNFWGADTTFLLYAVM